MNDLKYLLSYSIPLTAIAGLYFRDAWVFLTPIFAFVLVPILETLLPVDNTNLSEEKAITKKDNLFFSVLLYLNIPIVFGIISWFFWSIGWAAYSTMEVIGLIISCGIVLGSNGINVAHELGHRKTQWEKTLGKLLLLPSLYMHFYIEHNYGHHQIAATDKDPASAKYNQNLYSFWLSSISKQYTSAWSLQLGILKRNKRSFFSFENDMFWYHVFQSSYLLGVYFIFGTSVLFYAFIIAVISFVLLETINYIEHYGLSRARKESGRYERMTEIHSWNSNHVLGRVILYELTRHSDHHHRAHKPYQLLDCHETSPQMPYGYPTSMVLSMVPPIWFAVMNKRIPAQMKS